eukprot:g4518.t1
MFVPILLRCTQQLKRPVFTSVANSWFQDERDQERRIQEMILANSSAIQTPSPSQDLVDLKQYPFKGESYQSPISIEEVLTDSFKRKHTYLRISLTERCNLRCQYCMPAEGVELTPSSKLLTPDEIFRLAHLFVRCGIEKIRLTGGEPTIRRDIVEITRELAAIPQIKTLAMTTNGLVLEKKLEALKSAGLTALNISLDTLQPQRFLTFTRRNGHERVLRAINKALEVGFDPVKINVVVMKNRNEDEIRDFVELTRYQPINVRFIEYMPFDGNRWSRSLMVTYKEMFEIVKSHFPQGLVRFEDPKGEVAKNYKVSGFTGSVSFITSMTNAFCGDCTRLRLMADGNLKVCLFESNEFGLLQPMRSGASNEELLSIISRAVQSKKAAHAGMFELGNRKNRAMIKVGG